MRNRAGGQLPEMPEESPPESTPAHEGLASQMSDVGASTAEKPNRDGKNKTVLKWNRSDTVYASRDGFKRYWEMLQDVWEYQVMMISQGRCYLEHTFSFFPKDKKLADLNGLILGCNYGKDTSQVAIAKTSMFRKLTVIDIAQDLLDRQKDILSELGLDHMVTLERMDLNREHLPAKEQYDFVHAWGTIHHIKALEKLFSDINDALKDDGIFCMREYVGPSYLQFTDNVVQIVDRLLAALPEGLRRDENGRIKNGAWRPTIEEIVADDPSEAVRSGEILPVAEKYLDVLACRMTGGTLLNPLLHAIAGNFEENEAARSILKMLIAVEQTLIEANVVPSDYVYLIARKKASENSHVRPVTDSAP